MYSAVTMSNFRTDAMSAVPQTRLALSKKHEILKRSQYPKTKKGLKYASFGGHLYLGLFLEDQIGVCPWDPLRMRG